MRSWGGVAESLLLSARSNQQRTKIYFFFAILKRPGLYSGL